MTEKNTFDNFTLLVDRLDSTQIDDSNRKEFVSDFSTFIDHWVSLWGDTQRPEIYWKKIDEYKCKYLENIGWMKNDIIQIIQDDYMYIIDHIIEKNNWGLSFSEEFIQEVDRDWFDNAFENISAWECYQKVRISLEFLKQLQFYRKLSYFLTFTIDQKKKDLILLMERTYYVQNWITNDS